MRHENAQKDTYCSDEIISRFGIRLFGNQTIFPSSKPISPAGFANIHFPPFAYVTYEAIKYFVKKELKSIRISNTFLYFRCNAIKVKNNEAKHFEIVQYATPEIICYSKSV